MHILRLHMRLCQTHWYDPDASHGGVEAVLCYSQNIAYKLGGRALVKTIQKVCAKCRILHKKGVKTAMGPVGASNLNIAPPSIFVSRFMRLI